MDIEIPAALASNVAMQILLPTIFPTAPAPYILWGREESQVFSSPFRFELPFATNLVSVKRLKDCPICGVIPTELEGVNVPQRIIEILAEADKASS
jgi:hypothetical protein